MEDFPPLLLSHLHNNYLFSELLLQTLWNEQKRLQGHLDSPLTQEGIDNALALKKYLTDNALQFDCVYSSPIPRAYQTACLLFDQEKVITDDRLMEMNFGIFEGQKIVDLLKKENS